MTLNLNVPTTAEVLAPRITVVGIGGAGGNAVNNMIQSNLGGVEFLIANTDSQALTGSISERRIQLGRQITQGLGAGSRPDIGRAAAEECIDEIISELTGSHMVFITAGMGGGTGTGGAPVIARAAREAGILTVGVVTKPFHFEGVHRMRLAEAGIQELTQYVDTLIIIPNQNLFRVANEKTTFSDAFKMADDVLKSGVRGVTDLMVNPGLINLDFADIRSVMSEMGKAMMGTGEAEGENRAVEAAEAAISNPLLDDVSMKGARGVLINITGGLDLTLFEVDEAANRIRDEVDPEANIIFGSTFDQGLEGTMRVSVVATGIDAEAEQMPRPVSLSVVSSTATQKVSTPAQPSTGAQAVAQQEPVTASSATEPVMESQAEAVATAEVAMAAEAVEAVAAAVPAPAESVEDPEGDRVPVAHVGDSFFAPPPVEVASEPQLAAEARQGQPAKAEPFAEAALTNAGQAQQAAAGAAVAGRKPGQSLFARVTGSASRVFQAATTQPAEAAPQPSRVESKFRRIPASSEPKLDLPQQPTPRSILTQTPDTPQAAPQGAPAPVGAQPRLTGLENEQEEDVLDIPAFLRRQAN